MGAGARKQNWHVRRGWRPLNGEALLVKVVCNNMPYRYMCCARLWQLDAWLESGEGTYESPPSAEFDTIKFFFNKCSVCLFCVLLSIFSWCMCPLACPFIKRKAIS